MKSDAAVTPRSRNPLVWLWWLLSVFSLRHDFNTNPVIGSRLLNRCGLHVLRLLLGHGITNLRWVLLRSLMAPAQRAAFHRDGYLVLPNVLSEAELGLLQREIRAAPGTPRECIQGDTLTHRLLLEEQTLHDLPVTRRLLSDPLLAGLLRYAGAKNCAPFVYFQSIRNGVREGGEDPQKNLHSDTFHPTMKAWFFVADVRESDGPFCYVPGSNRLDWKRLCWEYRRSIEAAQLHDGYSEKGSFRFEAEDLAALGLPPPRSFPVPANTLVIANTFGIHCRGQAQPGARRLELWAYSRFNPFNPWPGIGLPWYHRADQALVKAWWEHLDREAVKKGQLSSWHPITLEAFRAD